MKFHLIYSSLLSSLCFITNTLFVIVSTYAFKLIDGVGEMVVVVVANDDCEIVKLDS